MQKDLNKRKLNFEQKKAVKFGEGPLLIIAGAGTGKTTVITERIKHLIIKNICQPEEILALTFTQKAADEMEERVDVSLPYGYSNMWISTFHSFCDRILKNEIIHIGLSPSYRLLSDADSVMLLKTHIFNLELDYFRPLGNPHKFIEGLLKHFARLKDEDISPTQYIEWVNKDYRINLPAQAGNKESEELLELKKYQELAKAYKFYEELKIKENLMDFGDLISYVLLLFRKRPNILKKYQEQFKFILIDEFQDTNISQYELIKLLAPSGIPVGVRPVGNPNLTVVGDDNQSIYKFRGAAISNILNFKKDYQNCKSIILNKNYRSYQYILDGAYKLIKHNDPDTLEKKLGISKKLKSVRKNNSDSKISFIHKNRVEDEAEGVAKEIKRLAFSVKDNINKSYSWKDFAILVRANNHAESFIRSLIRHNIPYQFLGPGQLYRQPEIKELISYLQVLNDITDDQALAKVLTMEFFDIYIRDLMLLIAYGKRNLLSLFEVCEIVSSLKPLGKNPLPTISQKSKEKISTIINMIHRHLKLLPNETAGQFLFYFLEDSGMLKNILEYKLPIDERQAGNITKFFNKLKSFEIEHEDSSIKAVLDFLMLSLELGESSMSLDVDWANNDAVNILTVHSCKGLEFPVVFLVNLVSQRFPTNEKKEQIPIPDKLIKEVLPEGDFHLEEERRLFYVGMTRAKDKLFFSAARVYGEGKREKKISPFVYEILGEQKIVQDNSQEVDQLSLLEWGTHQSVHPLAQDKIKTKTFINFLSYSQIETFKTCPLHYKLKYILKIPIAYSPALSFGISMHQTMKNFYELVQKQEPENLSILLNLLDQNWINEGYKNKQYEKLMKKRGIKYLEEYYKKEFNPKTKVLMLEEKFIFPINKMLKIGGKIDRVDDLGNGNIEIVDYKTGRVPTKREVDRDQQMSIYALAASEIPHLPFGKNPKNIKLSFYYFDTQEKISTTRTKEQLDLEKNNLLKVARDIEESDFGCSKNQFCKNCEYHMWCEV